MDITVTAIVMGFIAIVTLAANIIGRRPRKLGKVSLISSDVVQLFGLILLAALAAHLIGLITGHPLRPQGF